MKKLLKIIAIILVILALLILLSAAYNWMNGGSAPFGTMFGADTFLGKMTMAQAFALGAVGLVVAFAISPAGAKKAMARVTTAASSVAKSAGQFVTQLIGSGFKGIGKGILKSGLLWWVAGGVGLYFLWGFWKDERSSNLELKRRELELAEMERNANELHERQLSNLPSGG